MKRTILATVIAATSFGSFAANGDLPPVGEPIIVVPPHVSPILDPIGAPVEPGQPIDVQPGPIDDVEPRLPGNPISEDLVKDRMNERHESRTCQQGPSVDCEGGMTERGKHIVNNHATGEVAEMRRADRQLARQLERELPGTDPVGNPGIGPIMPEPTPVNPIEGEKPVPSEGQKLVEGLKQAKEMLEDAGYNLGETGQNLTESGKAAAQQAAVQQNQIDELYALGNQNASDIDTLFSEVDRLDTRIDQTQALNAATVNARPMVANGMTAFGAGVGYAGSEAALAIGVAHSFVDTGWSASGTLAASSDDVVVGAGAQYAF